MSRRVRCRSCQTGFMTDEETSGRPIVCPKCGAKHHVAAAVAPAPASAPAAGPSKSVFVPTEGAGRSRRGVKIAGGLVLAVGVLALAGVVAWPALKAWWNPVPPDVVETVAKAYLKALADGDSAAVERLGTVDIPPSIRTYRDVKHDDTRDFQLGGSFGPITAFHSKVNENYTYDSAAGRFMPRESVALGIAAEVLDAAHEAAEKNQKDGVYDKIAGGTPDEQIDAALALGKPMADLSQVLLAPQKLIPSYKQLVENAKPPLPASERALALDFGNNPETWDKLLKRPYPTLKSDGKYVLERAHVRASVIDALGSSGDPPVLLHLTLTRFRLEGMDTQWKVTSARRDGAPDAEPAAAPATSPKPSFPPRPY